VSIKCLKNVKEKRIKKKFKKESNFLQLLYLHGQIENPKIQIDTVQSFLVRLIFLEDVSAKFYKIIRVQRRI